MRADVVRLTEPEEVPCDGEGRQRRPEHQARPVRGRLVLGHPTTPARCAEPATRAPASTAYRWACWARRPSCCAFRWPCASCSNRDGCRSRGSRPSRSSSCVDDPGVLVAHRCRPREVLDAPVGPEVRAAHAGGRDADDRIPRLDDPGFFALVDPHVAGSVHHCSTHEFSFGLYSAKRVEVKRASASSSSSWNCWSWTAGSGSARRWWCQ
jgi:hypothetical protein